MVVNGGVSLVSFSLILAGSTIVVVINASPMCPAVVVVGKFLRGPVCEGSLIATTLMVIAVGLLGLLVDGLLDGFD